MNRRLADSSVWMGHPLPREGNRGAEGLNGEVFENLMGSAQGSRPI